MADYDVPEGVSMRPLVDEAGGDAEIPGDKWVEYANNGRVATYEVKGAGRNVRVELIG